MNALLIFAAGLVIGWAGSDRFRETLLSERVRTRLRPWSTIGRTAIGPDGRWSATIVHRGVVYRETLPEGSTSVDASDAADRLAKDVIEVTR